MKARRDVPPSQPLLTPAQIVDKPFFSFEFFPPRTADGVAALWEKMDALVELQPMFCDITWGAGGTTAELTLDIASRMQNEVCVETMMHLTCTNMPRDSLADALAKVKSAGLQNILALRGDPPKGSSSFEAVEGGFGCALDLVAFIRATHGDFFGLCVSGYPEGHPDAIVEGDAAATAAAYASDVAYLRRKVDAGAELVITQLFYDEPLFVRFVADCRAAGITVPILPGVMPITSYPGFKRMTSFCKTSVPPALAAQVEALKDDEEGLKAFGVAHAVGMCRRLLAAGAPGVHLYSLNQDRAAAAIVARLGLVDPAAPPRGAAPFRRCPSLAAAAGGGGGGDAARPVHWAACPKAYLARARAGWGGGGAGQQQQQPPAAGPALPAAPGASPPAAGAAMEAAFWAFLEQPGGGGGGGGGASLAWWPWAERAARPPQPETAAALPLLRPLRALATARLLPAAGGAAAAAAEADAVAAASGLAPAAAAPPPPAAAARLLVLSARPGLAGAPGGAPSRGLGGGWGPKGGRLFARPYLEAWLVPAADGSGGGDADAAAAAAASAARAAAAAAEALPAGGAAWLTAARPGGGGGAVAVTGGNVGGGVAGSDGSGGAAAAAAIAWAVAPRAGPLSPSPLFLSPSDFQAWAEFAFAGWDAWAADRDAAGDAAGAAALRAAAASATLLAVAAEDVAGGGALFDAVAAALAG